MTSSRSPRALSTLTSLLATLTSLLACGSIALLGACDSGIATTTTHAPVLSSISPSSGLSAGGVTVTLNGTGLSGATDVEFGTTLATSVTSISDSQLTAVSPAGSGTVDVSVTTPFGTSNSVHFTYSPAPILSAIAPSQGSPAGGTTVTLTGAGLTGASAVAFGANAGTAIAVISDSQLTVVSPAGSDMVAVTVTTPLGTSNALSFLYAATPIAPTIGTLTPNMGPIAGGTSITVTGTRFTGITSVTFGGTAGTSLDVTSDSALSVVAPAHAAGAVDVVFSTSTTSATATGAFTYTAGPVVTTVAPNAGRVVGGDNVTLTGNNLTGASAVTFGGAAATNVVVVSTTSITATTPAHTAGLVDVVVTTPSGATTATGAFTYAALPTLAGISPAAGATAGNTTTTITGTNLTGASAVTFGAVAATNVTVVNATTVTATTPAHGTGAVDIVVTTPGGAATLASSYTYDAAPTLNAIMPSSGSTAGGTSVTLSGTSLTSITGMTIGGSAATSVVVVNDTTVTALTPAHAGGVVDVVVASPGGSATLTSSFTYIAPAPTITSISPTFGPTSGTTNVVITGSNFVSGSTTVTIGGDTVTPTAVTSTSAMFDAPAHAAGIVDVTVTTSAGTATLSGGFNYTDVTATSISPAFSPSSGGGIVSINGTNFIAGSTSVTIGGITVVAAAVTVYSSMSLSFTVPAHVAGNVAVSVVTPNGTSGDVPGGFTYADAPTVSSLAPTAGPIGGGTLVTITGTGFLAGDTTVVIGGTALGCTVNNASSLTFSTPAHAAGNVAVSVSTSGGNSNAVPGGFTYETAPTAGGVLPSAGPSAGGSVVTISGTNFVPGDTSVTIASTVVPASSVTVNSSSSLTFSTPAHTAGNVAVSVSTSGGASGTISGGYTYEDAPTATSLTPSSGTSTGGTLVMIAGTSFVAGDTSVTIGGIVIPASSVTVNSPTSLSFSTPAQSPGNVAISVSTEGGTSALIPGGFTYTP